MSQTPRPRILLTGDDGYQSLGTRLLTHLLRDDFDLTIAGTVTQQSAVGGKISLAHGFAWGKTVVDGIPAFWVDGTPTDAMELIASYEIPKFDITISGINWGANLGTAVYGSGTFNAALGAVVRGASQQAIAISWDLPPEFYTMHHDVEHSLEEYLEYPGRAAKQLLTQCIWEKLWGAELLNINLPQKPTTEVRAAQFVQNVQDIYRYSSHKIQGEEGQFTFAGRDRIFVADLDAKLDVKIVTDGAISISPCNVGMVDQQRYQQLQTVQFAVG